MQRFLEYASKCYYEGNPVISDAEYDALEHRYGLEKVGYTITDGIEHFYPMYSLQKCFDLEKAPLNIEDCVISPKLDGAAVSLLYVDGKFALGLTRGDGKIGRDASEKLKLLVPQSIETNGIVQITGEVVCPSSVENARNVAAGSLNLKSIEEFLTRPLTFVAYDMQQNSFDSYSETMTFLESQGFHTVLDFDYEEYPTDGYVYRTYSNREFVGLGYTSHHPRGAFAYKVQKLGKITTLLDVVWQVGKSGVVSPVAVLEPVNIDDATVQKATLHNIEYIEGLGLEIGCKVEIIRSGDIIPRVVRRVD